ncbi:MAG: class B sortase [Coriobacteriia bacterium]|nr:class B sortase [Coriobacteriia bacterium]
MSVAVKIGRATVRTANGAINLIVLTAILLLLAFSCYALWDSKQVYSQADAKQYAKYKPTTEAGKLSFQELQSMNKDVCAWLEVYGTHIDYPVVQGTDNFKYTNTNAEGRYSLSGALFLDYNNKRDFSDFASIIYGHHMEEEAMFGDIGLFVHKSYFDERTYGSLYYGDKKYGLEFFAFMHADAYDSTVYRTQFGDDAQDRQAYLDLLLSRAVNVRSTVKVTSADRLVLLSTCSGSSTNGRDILVGRITDATYSDPFAGELSKARNPVIDRLINFWASAPVWVKILLGFLPLLLILIVIVIAVMRKKKISARQKDDAVMIGRE